MGTRLPYPRTIATSVPKADELQVIDFQRFHIVPGPSRSWTMAKCPALFDNCTSLSPGGRRFSVVQPPRDHIRFLIQERFVYCIHGCVLTKGPAPTRSGLPRGLNLPRGKRPWQVPYPHN